MSPTPAARVLIVDDEAALTKALSETLRGHGYATTGFTSGSQAIDALRVQPFDLLLTDLMMPEIDGISLLRAALEVDGNLVAIVMTGQGTVATAVEAMKAGALDYILKPFKLNVILPVLSRALEVRRLRLENAELAHRVRTRTEELEAANRELEAFCASVSHDLRNPLSAIDGFARLLSEAYSAQMPPKAQRMLTQVIDNTSRMNQLIEDLLRFSRLGRQALSKQLLNTATLVREVLEELRQGNSDRQVEIRVGELADCFVDPSLLRQVFVNLLSNAYKFTRERQITVIEIDCRQRSGENVYSVRDNGAGFDMRHANRVFEVFHRLHGDEQFEGTGVGLSIVQRIIQRHGGQIWAEAEVDKGATFYFSLPAISTAT